MGELYIITGPIGKQYIGATKSTAIRRFSGHITDSKRRIRVVGQPLRNAMRKYGADAFTVKTLVVGSTAFVFGLEDDCINIFETRSPKGYDVVRGGEVPIDPTPEIRYLMGANRGKKNPLMAKMNKQFHQRKKDDGTHFDHQSKAGKAAWAKPGHYEMMKTVLANNNKEFARKMREDPEFHAQFEAKRQAAIARRRAYVHPNQLLFEGLT